MNSNRMTVLHTSEQKRNSRVLPLVMFVVIMLLLSASAVLADTIQLPTELDEIGIEAFYSDSSLDKVILPEGIRIIGDRAFANSSANEIYLPDSIISIGQDAFVNCQALTCTGIAGSYAEEYCTTNHIPFMPIVTDPSCFEYETINGLKARITAYTGDDQVVVIPDEIDDYRITEISQGVFKNNTTIQKVCLPFYLEKLCDSQFGNCTNLTAVTMNDKLATISDYAFSRCSSLSFIRWSEGLETIGKAAFQSCVALAKADLPDSVKTIGSSAFEGCISLSSFHYPASWNSLPQPAWEYQRGFLFKGCSLLTTITIPDGVTFIPDYAFARCPEIRQFVIPDSVETIGAHAFEETIDIHDFTFPQSIQAIGSAAFSECDWLLNLDSLSNTSLRDVGNGAFRTCSNLVSANLPNTVEIIQSNAFLDCINLTEFHYPGSWNSVPKGAWENERGFIFKGCKKLSTITVPEGVTFIPDYAFARCDYLKYVNLPDGLESIGGHAFVETPAIRSFTFPASLQIIGDMAFGYCEWLEDLDSLSFTPLKEIRNGAFYQCTGLTSANLPDSVEVIESNAFYGCTNLASFHYPASWRTVPKGAWEYERGFVFKGCEKLKSITIPDGVTFIPDYAFARSEYIQTVDIPTSVTYIGESAFKKVTALTYTYLSEYIEGIGKNAFAEDPDLIAECEWGTYALSYLQNNNVNYFYLSLTNSYRLIHDSTVNSTMYKGDIYSLYGYVRSSVPVSRINITVYNSQNIAVIDETVFPDETDVLLNNAFSGLVCFENLELGTYHLTMDATAGDSTERLSNSTFTIVPPPLRIGVSDLNVPKGITNPSFTIGGTISANYIINQMTVTIWNEYETVVINQQVVSPYSNSYNLGNISNYFNFSDMPFGSYVFTIDIYTEAGNCTDYIHNIFIPVVNTTNYSEEQLNAILTFALDANNKSIFDSAAKYANDYFYNVFDQVDTFELGPIKLSFSTDAFIIAFNDYKDIAWGQINEKLSGRDTYLIDLYKGQIMAVIKEISGREVATTIDKNNFVLQVMDWIASAGDATLKIDQLGIVDSELLKAGAPIIKQFEDLFKAVKQAKPSVELANDLNRGIAYSLSQNLYEISIIQAVRNSMVVGTDVNSKAFSQAMDEVYNEYAVEGYGVVVPIIKYAIDLAKGENIKNILKLVGEDAGAFYSVANFAIKVYNKLSGLNDISNDRKSFIKIYDNACNASRAYKRAYDAINDGDTSLEALNSLYFTYCYARTSWKSMMDFLKKNWLPGTAVYFDAEHTKIRTMKFPGIEQ